MKLPAKLALWSSGFSGVESLPKNQKLQPGGFDRGRESPYDEQVGFW